jgi:hypothetical protein
MLDRGRGCNPFSPCESHKLDEIALKGAKSLTGRGIGVIPTHTVWC